MANNLTITIPNATRVKILSKAKSSLSQKNKNVSSAKISNDFSQAELIVNIITDEIVSSKNKYLIDLFKEFGDNKK